MKIVRTSGHFHDEAASEFKNSKKCPYKEGRANEDPVQIEIIKDKSLSEIVTKLKDHFKPVRIYLFGSRAQGTAHSESDYDLMLVVKNSEKDPTARAREARQILWGRSIAVDIFIYTEEEFNEFKDEFSSIAHTVATEGVEI